MNKRERKNFNGFLMGFYYASRGIVCFLKTPSNAWIHIPAAVIACLAGLYFKINEGEWFAIIFSIALVLVSEMLNTALETLTDLVSPDYHKLAERVKDIAAGAVLVSSIIALIIAVIIFIPRFIH
jgi:diacylglycerol kinase